MNGADTTEETDGPVAVVALDVSASGRKGGAGEALVEVDLEEMLGLRG